MRIAMADATNHDGRQESSTAVTIEAPESATDGPDAAKSSEAAAAASTSINQQQHRRRR